LHNKINKHQYHPYQKIDLESSDNHHHLSDHPPINNQKLTSPRNPNQPPPVLIESSKEGKEYSSREILKFVKLEY